MSEFLLIAALCVLGTVALGLVVILRGPTEADRLSAAQLLGTGGVAALLLLGVATDTTGVADLALVLALLAAFAAVAFITPFGTNGGRADPVAQPDRPQDPE
ncbi:monovalent cation/H+ antiporter complex subunit F [uncultured Thiodictyon sp.]|uniref:monovalent cation/H+ antiporter complex subunit F n=1 Tax=uncultured Thiodictyon sp. TaxID=1846217 RepID=UPI0025EBEA96|nr:monovalent cation/H+ antiporter complex subunit F [uncultured Thiodictyon sp.]